MEKWFQKCVLILNNSAENNAFLITLHILLYIKGMEYLVIITCKPKPKQKKKI